VTALPKPQIPRIVELLRVSGQGQADRDTPADQRAALDWLRRAFPGDLVETIDCGAVRAVSGAADLNDRPDLRRLAELSRAKAYDELRVRHIDRLTRHTDPRERFAIFGMVHDAGAVIRDASGHVIDPASEIGEVDYFLQTLMASRERTRICERTLAARRRLSAEGVPQTKLGYGRRYDRKTRTWHVVEEEARIYRRLYADVLDGKSLPQIAAALDAEGVPPPRGGARWVPNSIREMIGAENAIGFHPSYDYKIPCPPITDAETQRKALAALRANATWSGPRKVKREALLRKLARCPECGSLMHVAGGGTQGKVFYACGSRRKPSGADGACRRYHRVEAVDAAVLAQLRRELRDPEKLARGLAKANTIPGPEGQEQVEEIRAELAALDAREEKLTRLATIGKMSEAIYESQAAEIAKLREGAESRLSIAQGRAEARERRAVKARDLMEALSDAARLIEGGTFAGWRRVVELLFSGEGARILIHEDGTVTLDGGVPVTQPASATGCS